MPNLISPEICPDLKKKNACDKWVCTSIHTDARLIIKNVHHATTRNCLLFGESLTLLINAKEIGTSILIGDGI